MQSRSVAWLARRYTKQAGDAYSKASLLHASGIFVLISGDGITGFAVDGRRT